MTISTSIRVLLADDHTVVRAGIRQVLEHASDIQVVAEAGDGGLQTTDPGTST
jgi:DNA-binding NarL/FixJ family response regulator